MIQFDPTNLSTFIRKMINPDQAMDRYTILNAARERGPLTPRSHREQAELSQLFGPDSGLIRDRTITRDPQTSSWYKVHDTVLPLIVSPASAFNGLSRKLSY